MFLSELTREQQIAFYVFARDFITADDILAIKEYDMMSIFESEMDLSHKDVPEITDPESLLSHFDTRKSRSILLLELILLGYSDNDYCAEESDFIKRIAGLVGVDLSEVSEMEDWVKRAIAVNHEVTKFLE